LEKAVQDISNKIINRLNNVLSFYELYRDRKLESREKALPLESPRQGLKEANILDQWILTRLDELLSEVTDGMEKYDMALATRPFDLFIEDLSTWYLRRSRDRIKDGDKEAKQNLYFVLKTLAKLMAPFTPFTAEDIWLKLKNEKDEESVHLTNWPENKKPGFWQKLGFGEFLKPSFGGIHILTEMKKVREIVTTALDTRQKMGLKVRQPLSFMSIPYNFSQDFLNIIADEVNIKEIKFIDSSKLEINSNITPELKQEGDYRELVRAIQDMRKKMGLTPSDIVSLVFETGETGKSLIQKFEADMKKTVLVSEIRFKENDGLPAQAGEEIKIDKLVFKVKIDKI
jgi:isoleucyl-tRNA synthetase